MEARWVLNISPKEAQLIATHKAYAKAGWGHFLEMGIGKTSVALNEFELYSLDFDFHTHLVFAPNTFKGGWVEEAATRGIENVMELDSNNHAQVIRFFNKTKKRTLIANYELTTSPKSMDLIDKLVGEKTMITFDESIKLKNHDARTFKLLRPVAHECGIRRLLTGKPFVQGPHELWPQLRCLGALDGFNFYAFRNRFCKMGGFMGKEIKGVKEENQEELQKILAKWSWFASKRDYTDLPEKTWMRPRKVRMAPDQEAAYDEMENSFLLELQNGSIVTAEQVITRNMKLQQISSGFVYDENGREQWLIPYSKNPKLLDLQEFIETQLEGKLIVSAWHRATIEMLLEALAPYKPAAIRRDVDVEAEKARFNNDPTCRVIVCQQKMAKYGHTLLGSLMKGDRSNPCYNTYFFENSWSLDDRAQLEDRNHRNGQVFGVAYHDPYASEIEKRAILALQRKESVVAAVIGYAREFSTLPNLWAEGSAS